MEVGWLPAAFPRLIASIALAVALLALAPVAHGRGAATPTLRVTFTPSGTITVALPDGTPVGTTSGAPTTIPAGYYTLLFFGPGECINLPLFELRGPGVDINDDMLGGETDTHTLYATFLPNTTYTWHSDRNSAVVYSFRASSDVVAAQPGTATTSTSGTTVKVKPASQDIVGSAVLPFRGTLAAAVNPTGQLTLAFKGKSVTSLKAGRYTIAVSDRSSTNGFVVQKLRHAAVNVTGLSFVGRHSVSLMLTAGKWLVMPRLGRTTYAIVVS